MGGPKQSAGLLMYRLAGAGVELFLVHPGGPYFARKDEGAWSLPKGEIDGEDEPLAVARREFEEETGQSAESCGASGEWIELGSVRQRGGKTVHAWAFEGDWPPGTELRSDSFELEWPPRSGQRQRFPEVDRAEFFVVPVAREKINAAQRELIDRLLERLR